MGHRTDHNRIGLAMRGLSTVAVAAVITLVMLPEAASESRYGPARPASVDVAYGTTVDKNSDLKLFDKKGVWATPQRTHVIVGRLTVPAINLDVPFRLGVRDAIVRIGPGLWPGTPLPGQAGNAVLAGHRTTHTHPFENLDRLHKGDVIRTRIRGGRATRFTVYKSLIVREARYGSVALRQPDNKRARLITLFACTPKGFRTHRIVVKARASRIPREMTQKHAEADLDTRVLERS